MSLRDLGKTAQLLLDGGRGLIPEDYLRRATQKQIGTPFQPIPEERLGYGYQFWRVRDGYMFYGMGGQLALICPDKQMILCTIGDTQLDPLGTQNIHDAFFEELVPAVPVTDERYSRPGNPGESASKSFGAPAAAQRSVYHTVCRTLPHGKR